MTMISLLGYSRPTKELTQSLTVLAWFLTGKIIETEGTSMPVPRHAVELFKLVDSNRNHLREWIPFVDDYQSVRAATQFITRTREKDGRTISLGMGIWAGKLLAGVVTFDHIDWSNRAALIGFWLGKSFQGRGIMTRTCRVLIGFAFDELHLNRIEISCAVENRRCRMVPERLGFKQEG